MASPATILFVARDGDGPILGSLTLALFRIPTGLRAWIEDVVVDEAARGKGVGAALNEAALDHARTVGARTVDLTSRPSREVANRLYQRLGFVERDDERLPLRVLTSTYISVVRRCTVEGWTLPSVSSGLTFGPGWTGRGPARTSS